MLPQNMYIGMKVAKRSTQVYPGDKVKEEQKQRVFENSPYYIVRWLERQGDEINRAKEIGEDPRAYCVINQEFSKTYREGNYAHCELLEPYDLVMEKLKTKGSN